VSVPMTVSDLERRDARHQIFQADLHNASTCDLQTIFVRITLVWAGRNSRGSATPLTQGGGAPALLNFWGSLLYYICMHPLSHNYQIWRDNTCSRCLYLAVSHASHPKRAEFQGSPISNVLLYLCPHPLY